MAITTVGQFPYPGFYIPQDANRSITLSAITLDAATEKAAAVFQVPKTGNISHVHFRNSAAAASGDADVRLETVDLANGQPSGTLFGTNTNGAVTINAANTWRRVALTAAAAVTKNQLIGLAVENVTGNYTITLQDPAINANSFPYGLSFTGGAWSKLASIPAMMVEYDDATYPWIPNAFPITAGTSLAINTGTTPDEVGLKFVAPGSLRAAGLWMYADIDNAADVILYDSGGGVVASVTALDGDVRSSTGMGKWELFFDAPVTLTAGATYRLVLKPTTASSVALSYYDINNSAYITALPGTSDMVWTQRTDAGAFSETLTRRPLIGLIVDGIDFGGSAPIGPGGLRGGFQ